MIEPVKWPLQTNPEMRDGILADKLNELIPYLNYLLQEDVKQKAANNMNGDVKKVKKVKHEA